MRTSARGAGTRQAPCRHASHISSQEASNATDSPASTRSPGPIGSSARNRRASASTNAAAERWRDRDALRGARRAGREDDPRVVAVTGCAGGADRRAVLCHEPVVAEHGAHPGLAEDELGPLFGVVGVDGDVGGARGEDGEDGDVELGGAGGDPDADAVADPDADTGEAPPDDVDLLGEPAIGEHRAARVDRVLVRVLRRGLGEHVEQRAAARCGRGGEERGSAGECEGHRAPACVGAWRRQRGARGRMSHLSG